MNPTPFVFWMVTGCVLGLAPRLLLGWSWWAALGAGMLAAPPFLWLVAAALDRYERGAPAVQPPPPPVPTPLVLEAAPACPKCGGAESANVLYGLPAFTDELKKAIEEKRVVLAGCPVYAGAPRFICVRCGERHGTAVPGTAATG